MFSAADSQYKLLKMLTASVEIYQAVRAQMGKL